MIPSNVEVTRGCAGVYSSGGCSATESSPHLSTPGSHDRSLYSIPGSPSVKQPATRRQWGGEEDAEARWGGDTEDSSPVETIVARGLSVESESGSGRRVEFSPSRCAPCHVTTVACERTKVEKTSGAVTDDADAAECASISNQSRFGLGVANHSLHLHSLSLSPTQPSSELPRPLTTHSPPRHDRSQRQHPAATSTHLLTATRLTLASQGGTRGTDATRGVACAAQSPARHARGGALVESAAPAVRITLQQPAVVDDAHAAAAAAALVPHEPRREQWLAALR
jgi:hypothetical protein